MNLKIGNKIKTIRLENGMTQEHLAGLAGMNPRYLGEIERGQKNPSCKIIMALSKALNIPVCLLLPMSKSSQKCNDVHKEIAILLSGRTDCDINRAIRMLKILFE